MGSIDSLVVVVPVRGKGQILTESLSSLSAAVRQCSQASLLLVDNNEPHHLEPALYRFADEARILRSTASAVGGVRNDGVRACSSRATHLVFVDCDCVVHPSFCVDVMNAFEASHASIVGCRVISPADGHWTERASDALHRSAGDGPRNFLNSGCLAVRADVFAEVGGFSESLPANEDYDFCARVRAHGGTIWQFESLQAVHLGNPKSISGFMKRLSWHGRGAVGADGRIDFSSMLIATLLNFGVVVAGFTQAIRFALLGQWMLAVLTVLGSLFGIPLAFWCLRVMQFRRFINPFPSVALMQLTFVARQFGFLMRLIELHRANRIVKDLGKRAV